MKIWLFFIFILLLGCLQSPTTKDRLACLSLTQDPHTSVPHCLSAEKCFEEIKMPFEKESLSHETQASFFEAKNSLARSWLFFNLAKKNLSNINTECNSGNYSKIPVLVNEFTNNLAQSAGAIDVFNEHALVSIALATAEFKDQKIDLIKEEKLFNDYILLNQNLLDYSQKNTGGTSYSSIFLREYEKFSESAKILGVDGRLAEVSAWEILSKNQKLAKAALGYDFKFGLLFPVFVSSGRYLEGFLSLENSVESLEKLPAQDFFLGINRVIGSENSAAFEYLRLFSNLSTDVKSLIASNLEKAQKINSKIPEIKEKQFLISKNFGLYEQIVSFPAGQGGIEFAGDMFPDISEIDRQILETESNIEKLNSGFESLTIGEISKELSLLDNKTEDLLAVLEEYQKRHSQLFEICSEKISFIQSKLPQEPEQKILLETKINSYNSAKDPQKCLEILRLFSEYGKNGEKENQTQLFGQCLAQTEELINSGGFSDMNAQLNALKKQEYTPQYFSLCQDLKTSAMSRFENEKSFADTGREIVLLRADLNSLFEKIRQLPQTEGFEEQNLRAKNDSLVLELEGLDEAEKKSAIMLSEKISLLIDSNKLSQAKKDINALENQILHGKETVVKKGMLEEDAGKLRAKILALSQYQENLSASISVLEKQFLPIRQDELSEIYHFIPITQERLKELSKQTKPLAFVEKIKNQLNSGEYLQALELAQDSNLEQKSEYLAKSANEASFALQKLKENSVSAYNIALAKKNASNENAAAGDYLKSSEQDIKSGDYVLSLLNSQRATGLLELKQNAPEIPLAAYALIAVAIIIAGYFLTRPKKEPEDDLN